MKLLTDTDYIHALIAEGEHQQQDFKFEISDARKIAKTLSAFANTNGGRLLIGVKDNGKIAGVRSEEEKYMIEAAAQLYCVPEVEYSLQTYIVEGRQVLVATIEETPHKPVYVEFLRWLPLTLVVLPLCMFAENIPLPARNKVVRRLQSYIFLLRSVLLRFYHCL